MSPLESFLSAFVETLRSTITSDHHDFWAVFWRFAIYFLLRFNPFYQLFWSIFHVKFTILKLWYQLSWKVTLRIIKSMFYKLSFTLYFSTKQSIRTALTHNQYIHLSSFSTSPTKEKITVIISKPQRHEKNNGRNTMWRPKRKRKSPEFLFTIATGFGRRRQPRFFLFFTQNHRLKWIG